MQALHTLELVAPVTVEYRPVPHKLHSHQADRGWFDDPYVPGRHGSHCKMIKISLCNKFE